MKVIVGHHETFLGGQKELTKARKESSFKLNERSRLFSRREVNLVRQRGERVGVVWVRERYWQSWESNVF